MHTNFKSIPWQVKFACSIWAVLGVGIFITGLYILANPSPVTSQGNSRLFALMVSIIFILLGLVSSYFILSIYKGSKNQRNNTTTIFVFIFLFNSIKEISNMQSLSESILIILLGGLLFITPAILLYSKQSNKYFNNKARL